MTDTSATCRRPGCRELVEPDLDGPYCGNDCEIEHLTDQRDELRVALRNLVSVVVEMELDDRELPFGDRYTYMPEAEEALRNTQ